MSCCKKSSCCPPEAQPKPSPPPATIAVEKDADADVYDKVKDYYGKRVTKQSELETSACLLQVSRNENFPEPIARTGKSAAMNWK